ncbi:ubiquitin-protein ligase [Ectocarpus siliculosus]|uniref:Ubiquitin-protein ligase n=1 Tax=Ectocarpus siliculosus TaxID=2880 RepID=D7G818_ECTSI|nr:ubiquitin-protein ligase [Ectocarpus siliculosus]|eukprot:CBJ27893.1 ubiquitin-protein ligase [Ectocarpus siliculosus]
MPLPATTPGDMENENICPKHGQHPSHDSETHCTREGGDSEPGGSGGAQLESCQGQSLPLWRPLTKTFLKPDWEARDVKGRIVYINHTTRTTQWSKPKFSSKKGVATAEPVASAPSKSAPSKSASGRANGGAAAGPAGGGSKAAGPVTATPTRLRGANFNNSVPGSNLPAPAGVASRAVTTVSSPLPAGWESKIIDGRVVYIDHANQRTSFERPRGQAGGLPQKPRPLSARRQMGVGVDGELVPHSNGAETNLGSSRGSHRSGHLADPIYASNASSAVGDSPLPPGWGRSVTPNGELYYVNHVSKTTTWSRPQWTAGSDGDEESVHGDGARNPESLASIKSGKSTRSRRGEMLGKFAESAEPPLPPGWEERMSAEGKVFYMNHNDKTTHWTRPDPPPVQPDDSPDDDVPPVEREDVQMATGSTANVGAAAATVVLEEVADSSPGRGGFGGGVVTNPRRAPSATVVAAVAAAADDEEEEEASRSVDAPSPTAAAAAARKEEPGASSSGKAAEPIADDDDDAAREGEGGEGAGAGAVSSIVRSGLFGATVVRPGGGGGGGSSGDNSSKTPALNRSGSSVVPLYASKAGGVAGAAAAAAAAAEKSKPELEKPEVDSLPEGWIELKSATGKTYYQNSISKTTQWNRPEPTKAVAALKTATYNSTSSPAVEGAAAEAGWEKVMTADGRPYFQNTITKTTSWQLPEGWVEPGAAAASTEAETTVAGHGSFFKSGGGGSAATVKELGVEAPAETDAVAVAPTPIGRLGGPAASSTRSTPVPKAEAQEAPLPPGWEKLYTEEGVPFWTNHNERTTSWDPPVPAPAPAATPTVVSVVSEVKGMRQESLGAESELFESVDGGGAAEATEAAEAAATGVPVEGTQQVSRNLGADGRPLPEGWEMQTTDQGIPYYVDHLNKRTSWDPPMMSSGGMSVIASELPDIPPAELVPDSADLYMGADLLNRFFGSWMGDAQGKSPLEAARNVIVTYLTGPGLKVTKGRNAPNLQRFLYLSPTNKQVVWATKATSKGKLSKKGLTLDGITELHSEDDGIRVEARGESSPLILKSAAVDTLTSEGATILLGVLLADMTGTMLRLQGVSGGDGSCYYPASFVEDVLAVRRARMEKNAALAAAATTPRQEERSTSSQGQQSVALAEAKDQAGFPQRHRLLPLAARGAFFLLPGSNSAASLTYSDSGESDDEKDAGRAATAAAAAAATAVDGGRAPPPRSSSSSGFVEPSRAASSYTGKPEIATSIAMSAEDEDADCPLPKEEAVPAVAKEDEGAVAAAAAASASAAAAAAAAASAALAAETRADAGVPETAAVVETEEASQPVVNKPAAAVAEEPAAEEEEEEDEETREYRSVLTEMLRPVKMEKYVESFLGSGITLDILPLVERGDLQTEVGIAGAVPQLKIMKAIKTRFPDGI